MKKKPSPKRTRARRPARLRPAAKPVTAAQEKFGISSILVPIDFSVHSKNALKYAVPLAEKFRASLHLPAVRSAPQAARQTPSDTAR